MTEPQIQTHSGLNLPLPPSLNSRKFHNLPYSPPVFLSCGAVAAHSVASLRRNCSLLLRFGKNSYSKLQRGHHADLIKISLTRASVIHSNSLGTLGNFVLGRTLNHSLVVNACLLVFCGGNHFQQ